MVRLPSIGLIVSSIARQGSLHTFTAGRKSISQNIPPAAVTISNRLHQGNIVAARFYSSSMKPQVFLTRPDFAEKCVNSLKEQCDITGWKEESPIPQDELIRGVSGKDALFCTLNDKIDAKVLDAAGPKLKVIGTMSVGYDHIDLAECKKRGIRVGYTPDVLTDATADLAMALLLATSRRLIEANHEAHNGGWTSWSPFWMCGVSLKNSVVGFVGFGRIAQEVAKRVIPFKPKKIIFSNRSNSRDKEAKEVGATRVPLEELLATSDFVILLCALTPETNLLINAKTLAAMKSSAVLINVSRGGVVDQNDLYEALKANTIRAAGLDVTTPEPLPSDHPLLTLKNCVVLPHIGSADIFTREEMCRITVENIVAGLNDQPMVSEL